MFQVLAMMIDIRSCHLNVPLESPVGFDPPLSRIGTHLDILLRRLGDLFGLLCEPLILMGLFIKAPTCQLRQSFGA